MEEHMARERLGPGPGGINTRESGYDPLGNLNKHGTTARATFPVAKRATEALGTRTGPEPPAPG